MFLGIDLGTTNTVVARSFIDSEGRLVTEIVQMGQMYNYNWEKFLTLPSMVYFDGEDIIVGREAKDKRSSDRENIVVNAKRFMGTQHCWKIGTQEYQAKDIAAMVLQHCKRTLDREGNMKYDTVVITVPASFNPDQIEDTLRAAKQAGFKEEQVFIKHEPTAALLSFIHEEAKKKPEDRVIDISETKRIMVFDLGGGTCDTSIIDVKEKEGGELYFTEVGIGRYQELGGIDFDARLAEGLLNTYFKENNILEGTLSKKEQDRMYRELQIKAEVLKERLSSKIKNKLSSTEENEDDFEQTKAQINIPNFYQDKNFKISITKAEYDEYTKTLYNDKNTFYKKFEDMDKDKNIITVIRKTLEEYDIKKSSIDYVFMTGGMSQFPTVQQKVAEYIGKPLIFPENPMDAVAKGAAIYQYYKVREEIKGKKRKDSFENISKEGDSEAAVTQIEEVSEGIVDTMMLAEAILLDMNEGLPRVIIPKQTVVPYEDEIKGEFRTASPSGIMFNIYAAEDEMDSSMRIQKSVEKAFSRPVPSGTPFDIKYKINENKAIEMKIILHDATRQVIDISVRSDIMITEKNYNLVLEDDY